MPSHIQIGALAMQIGLAAVAAFGLVNAWTYELWTAGQPGAGLYPFGISTALLVLLGFSIVKDWRWSREAERTEQDELPDHRRFLSYLGALLIFGAFTDLLGYLLTALLALVTMLFLGERVPFFKAIVLALIISLATWGIFVELFSVPLATWPAAFRQ